MASHALMLRITATLLFVKVSLSLGGKVLTHPESKAVKVSMI